MKENIKQKINEWAQKFNQDKTEETLEKIFIELSNFSDEAESTQVEKLVVLINQCIILDTLNTDNYKIENNVYTRNDIVEGIKVIYEEFIQSSVIDEWENESTIAFKEYVSYIIALILYKVNNYEEAYKYFGESRKFSTQLDNVENPNGLDSLSQIKRDIYFAYCCEYIGTPLMNYERLAEALQILLGTKAEIENYRQYWHQLKVECYDCISEINRAFSSNDDLEKKTKKIINLLLSFANDKQSVFSRLTEMQKKGKNVRDEYREAVHVLAHCINELNMGLMVGGNDSEEALENYKKRNLMKLFACMCIDSLGECYATCQATIRAEQGNGIDAISRMHQIDNGKLDEQDRAELDFYQYYFESMFHHQDYEKVHKHGQKFFEFCKNQHVSNRDKFQDGLLHFYVVSLRMQLKMFLEEFVNSKNRNKLFFQDEKRICNSGCFGYYEELRKKEFSEFVNIQMIREREKLIIVYKILRNLQNSKLPLFYEQENFGKDLAIDESIEELYDLCKKFIKLSKGIGRNYCFGEDSKEKFNHDKEQKDKYLIRINTINVGAFVCAEGLGFELYGNIEIFLKYFKNHPFIDYKMLDESAHNEYKVNSKSKILYFEDAESCFNCCCELFKNSEGKIIRVFYVGEPDEDLAYKEIAAFKTVNICFLMAYIYESIEKILDYIFNPTPIYILAPLRSASNYEFQEARFDSLLKYPDKFSAPIEVRSDGIGIVYRKDYIKDDHFHISFINDDVQNACIGIIKMHANNLYVMRGERLVRKESVHIGLVNKMYNDFAEARKAAEKKRHENCEGEASTTPSCSFFYKCLGNERDCSRGKFEAVKKLWQLFNIACEEQVLFTDECYFLQTSFVMEKYPMDGGFQICIFDRNITDFISKDCCLREVVSINKGTIVREKGEKVYMPIVDDIEKRNDVIKKLEELIKKCKDEVEMCQINNGDVSIGLIRNILEEAQTTLREVKNGDRIDFAKIEGQWIKWRQELEKIKD